MTNKQTIDGVSRALLERFAKGATTGAERRELRSLLDKPIVTGCSNGIMCQRSKCEECGGDGFVKQPAAQPQGEVEPVAYRYMNCNTGTYGPTKDGSIYYAEIPEYGREWEVTTKAHGAVLVERKEHAIASGYVDSHPSITVIIEPLYTEQRSNTLSTSAEPKPATGYPNRLCHIDFAAHPYHCGCLKGDDEAQRRFDEHHGKASAELKPRGEPVAWASPESLGGIRWRPQALDGLADGAPLYCRPTEQAAPLATEAAKAFA